MASDPTERHPSWADETQRLDRPLFEPETVRDYGQTARVDDQILPEDDPADYGYDPQRDPYREQRGRWGTGVLIILVLIALIGGILVGGLFTRPARAPTTDDLVPSAALQDAQAQVSDRDAQIAERDGRIAELEGRLGQIQEDQDAAESAREAALEERRAALDERQAALDAREQALNEREQASDGDDALPDIELPDVGLPDLPTGEETRNALERVVDRIRELFN